MSRLRRAGYSALKGLSRPWRAVTAVSRSRLRILAYHDVPDRNTFTQHMSHLAEHYRSVTGPQFASTSRDRPPVWITFDDGDPTIVDNANEVLSMFGFHGTAFICPSLVGTTKPYWWQVVHAAAEAGVTVAGIKVMADEVRQLKSVPDADRRRRVSKIREHMPEEPTRRQLTSDELQKWLNAGHSIGNHSWDHPMLDQCPPEEQRRQIDRAHVWFLDNGYGAPRWFAYPNGSWSNVAEQHLVDLGYESALLFDHRLASMDDVLSLSRIRVNGTDSLNEFISKISGIHPAIMRWRR